MKTKSIKQKILFKTSPHEVYDALMDSKKHTKFTGATAKISRNINGKFSVYDGYAFGKNLELVPDKKIVQTWRASDWEEGINSQVVFEITPAKNGCTLIFTQTDVPDKHFSSIKQGWVDFYWVPMKKMFEIVKK
ncbi:MAG: SRPBCC family protein [Bacteroidota bacterium]|nr:SRPBCC family protein [Bacteroidota bacterium]